MMMFGGRLDFGSWAASGPRGVANRAKASRIRLVIVGPRGGAWCGPYCSPALSGLQTKSEARIFRELRRLYVLTPQREAAILRELRRASAVQTPEAEERFFWEINKAQKLPEGAVPQSVQGEQALRLFRKLDFNGDGFLNAD